VELQTKCGGFASLGMNCNRKSRSLRDDNQSKRKTRAEAKATVKAKLGLFVASTVGEAAAAVAVDGALFVAGGAVVFLLGDGGEVGGVVLGGHGYGAEEEASEGGMLVENFAALGVDVEEVEGGWG